jgi:hypothetical protein
MILNNKYGAGDSAVLNIDDKKTPRTCAIAKPASTSSWQNTNRSISHFRSPSILRIARCDFINAFITIFNITIVRREVIVVSFV